MCHWRNNVSHTHSRVRMAFAVLINYTTNNEQREELNALE